LAACLRRVLHAHITRRRTRRVCNGDIVVDKSPNFNKPHQHEEQDGDEQGDLNQALAAVTRQFCWIHWMRHAPPFACHPLRQLLTPAKVVMENLRKGAKTVYPLSFVQGWLQNHIVLFLTKIIPQRLTGDKNPKVLGLLGQSATRILRICWTHGTIENARTSQGFHPYKALPRFRRGQRHGHSL
jgi:hypothetical protein